MIGIEKLFRLCLLAVQWVFTGIINMNYPDFPDSSKYIYKLSANSELFNEKSYQELSLGFDFYIFKFEFYVWIISMFFEDWKELFKFWNNRRFIL